MRFIKTAKLLILALTHKLNAEGDKLIDEGELYQVQAKAQRYRLDIEKFDRFEGAVKKLIVGLITVILPPEDAQEAIKAFYDGMGEFCPIGLGPLGGPCQHPESARKAALGLSGDVAELHAESIGADVVVFEGASFRRTLTKLSILAAGKNPFARWTLEGDGSTRPVSVNEETRHAARLILDVLAGKASAALDLAGIIPEGAKPYDEATDCPACDVTGCDGTPCDSAPPSGTRAKGE